jgi:inner membrane protein
MNLDFLRSSANWFAFGVVLGIVELLVPGFVFLGFAIGAAVVSLVLLLIGPTVFEGVAGIAYLAVVWAVASYAAWTSIRKLPSARAANSRVVDRDINESPYKGDRD